MVALSVMNGFQKRTAHTHANFSLAYVFPTPAVDVLAKIGWLDTRVSLQFPLIQERR